MPNMRAAHGTSVTTWVAQRLYDGRISTASAASTPPMVELIRFPIA